MAQTPFKLLGLTQAHKDFLHRYAQSRLGSSSRTKAILALIDKAMREELGQNHSELFDKKIQDELMNQAINNKQTHIKNHRETIEIHAKNLEEAKSNQNYELVKKLSSKKLGIKKQRIQLSIPVYDYEYLEKLAKNSKSSVQYYTKVLILEHLYNEKRLLGVEIESLRKSNYELFKIGANINQIAKANNVGNKVDLPINKLYNKIQNHIQIVQNLLQYSIDIY